MTILVARLAMKRTRRRCGTLCVCANAPRAGSAGYGCVVQIVQTVNAP